MDCTKANIELNWTPVWNLNQATEKTARWYSDFIENKSVNTYKDLVDYIDDSTSKKMVWSR